MNKKIKILFWVLSIIIIISIFLTYKRSFITAEFEIIPVSDDFLE